MMGWLYVGDVEPEFHERLTTSSRPPLDPDVFLDTKQGWSSRL